MTSLFFVTGCYTRLELPVNEKNGDMRDESKLEILEVVYPVEPPRPPIAPPFQPPVIIRPVIPAPAPPLIGKTRTNDQERIRSVIKKDKNLRNNSGERSSQSGRKR